MEYNVARIARLAGTTSRTLRHYDSIGLLRPRRTGANGYRYYDEACLIRLQRILLLRDLGLSLADIARVIDQEDDSVVALQTHRAWLREEKARLSRQISAVTSTITALQKGEPLMVDTMFDGFDHTAYKEEVERRWGKDAYTHGDQWWRSLTPTEKEDFLGQVAAIEEDFAAAKRAGLPVTSSDVRSIAQRHYDWVTVAWGRQPSAEEFRALGQMYVDDPRFAANYGGTEGARYVCEAMATLVKDDLS